MRVAIVLAACALVGCDRVFLDPTGKCPYAHDLPADEDVDGDGKLNGADACPRVAGEPANDEDGDGTLDACDLCPQLAPEASGTDEDCDGLAAACDPDDAIAHERQFYGFDGPGGLAVTDVAFAGGAAQIVLDADNRNSYLRSPMTVSSIATYELAGSVALVPATPHVHVGVVFGPGRLIGAGFRKYTDDRLRLAISTYEPNGSSTQIVTMDVGVLAEPRRVRFVLRATVTPENLTTSISVDGAAPLSISTDGPMPTEVFEVLANLAGLGTPTEPVTVELEYLTRAAVVSQPP